MEFECIWACDEESGIGRDGGIPWNVPHDLKNFREITSGNIETNENIVIMGRKTWDSLPRMFKPLKNRVNIVVTSDVNNVVDYERWQDEVAFVPGFESAVTMAEIIANGSKKKNSNLFVIGGSSIYRQALQHEECVGIHETIVWGDFQCDTFAPEWVPDQYDMVQEKVLSDRATYFHWRKSNSYIELQKSQ